MADLGDAKLTLRTDNTNFKKGIDESNQRMDDFRKKVGLAITAAGAAITGFAVLSVKNFADYADGIDKVADRSQLTTDLVQEMALVLGRNGQAVEDLDKVMDGLDKALGALQLGTGKQVQAFHDLGITVDDVNFEADRMDEIFLTVIKRLQNVEQDTKRTQIATDLFAGGQKALAVTLTNSNEQFDEIRRQAHEMGLVLENDGVKSGAALTDQMGDLGAQMAMVQVRIGELISPFLIMLLDKLIAVTNSISTFTRENETLVRIIGLGTVALGGFITIMGVLTLTMSSVKTAFGLARAAVALFNTTLIANPIGAIIVAITTLTALIIAVRMETGSWTETLKVIGEVIINSALIPINLFLGALKLLGKGLGAINEDWGFTVELMKFEFEPAMKDAAKATDEFRTRAKYNFDITKDAYLSMYDGMVRATKDTEKVITETATEEAVERIELMNDAIITTQRRVANAGLTGGGIRQSVASMQAGVSPNAGRQQMFEDLARSEGKLQVSTGERDASGGVIFRDATQDDFNRIFKDDIQAKLPSLLGVTPFDAQAERSFFGALPGMRTVEGGTNVNVSVSGKDLASAFVDIGDEQGGIL